MNYYEELGVKPTASAEEIRQAYKELVRLLHPDQHQDERLRQAAERQLKRLNQVVAVLTDPVERRRYDLSLAAGPMVRWAPAREVAARVAEAARRTWVWWLTAAVGVVALALYSGRHRAGSAAPTVRVGEAGRPVVAAPQTISVPDSVPISPPRAPATSKTRTRKEAPAVEATVAPQALPTANAPVEETAPVVSLPRATEEHAPEASNPPAPVAQPAPKGLAGVWLYVPPRAPPEQSEAYYPPEYIELRLIEHADDLYGRYRARYRITDRTVWPEVSFEFQGKRQQKNFAWRGSGGARGEVRLKLLGADQLEVTWWASELGEQAGLASGTAVLVREAASAKEVR